MKLYRQRLLDPWLPVTNFTDYLIKEFDSMQKNCSTTLSYRTSASTLYVGPATTTTSTTTSGNATTKTSTSSTATPTCLGQEVKPLKNWLTCNDLCDKYAPPSSPRHIPIVYGRLMADALCVVGTTSPQATLGCTLGTTAVISRSPFVCLSRASWMWCGTNRAGM
jgi:hypothetical protein